MKEHIVNKKNFFLKGWYIDKKICDDLINYFNKNKDLHVQGITSEVNNKDKKSTDLILSIEDKILKDYSFALGDCFNEYKKIHPGY